MWRVAADKDLSHAVQRRFSVKVTDNRWYSLTREAPRMSLAVTLSRAQQGMAAPQVTVEVFLSGGLPGTAIVGLPEAAVREARDRVRVALQSSAFQYPRSRVTINLAPAELPKHGGRFDLALAVGILVANGQAPRERLATCEFLGELALSGALRPVDGLLPALLQARRQGRSVIVPRGNAAEAGLVEGVDVRVADTLADVGNWLHGGELEPAVADEATSAAVKGPDLADVRGQWQARRALEIAAAGGHHLLLSGPPGTGKTMLAERLPGILPTLEESEALEACAVRSVAGMALDTNTWRQRPFRAPHHTASAVAVVGGGSQPHPGEISLAHQGVLFLDELPEFNRQVLEVLREPLESGEVVISRALHKARFPARFQLVAAMNPCPCGHAGDADGRCRCTLDQIARYRGRISGPLLDRVDLQVEVPRVPVSELGGVAETSTECSAEVRQRVVAARADAVTRNGSLNAQLTPASLEGACALDETDRHWFERALEQLRLSARAYHRVLRVARTVADLDHSTGCVTRPHLAEALQLHRAGTS